LTLSSDQSALEDAKQQLTRLLEHGGKDFGDAILGAAATASRPDRPGRAQHDGILVRLSADCNRVAGSDPRSNPMIQRSSDDADELVTSSSCATSPAKRVRAGPKSGSRNWANASVPSSASVSKGAAFHAFWRLAVERARHNAAMCEAFTAASGEPLEIACDCGPSTEDARAILAAAQSAEAVRVDIDVDVVMALLSPSLVTELRRGGERAPGRLSVVVLDAPAGPPSVARVNSLCGACLTATT
jgi:hypothetical protein